MPVYIPDMQGHSHTIRPKVYIHVQNQRKLSAPSLTCSQPWAETFNKLQPTYSAGEMDGEGLTLATVWRVRTHNALLSFLLEASADLTQHGSGISFSISG